MKENRKRLISLFLMAVMLFGLLPATSYADEGEAHKTRFVCDAAAPNVTVYDSAGEMIGADEGGYYYLISGNYYYSAEAEGFESQIMQPFNVPADAEGDQELLFTMVPLNPDPEQSKDMQNDILELDQNTDDGEKPENPQDPGTAENQSTWTGGIFNARYSRYQAFDVQRSPAYPTGTQESPDAFTVKELACPVGVSELGEEDYFYFVGQGPASQTGVAYSESWNAAAEALDPFTVSLHIVRGGADSELARGVIGAFSDASFLFAADGYGTWFSNTRGYRYTSESISYNPVPGGRLVCDAGLLTGCLAQSMLEPDPDAPDHVHKWTAECDGASVVFRCEEAGCPYGTNTEYSMTLNVPAFVYHAESVEAAVGKSVNDEEWPAELEQNVICYVGRGSTEYGESMTPPTAVGTYTARVSVGYRLNPQIIESDFAVTEEMPVPFDSTQTINGVVVTVKAEAGVFPSDAVLSVSEAVIGDLEMVAIAAARGTGKTPVASAAVDIRIVDANGEILQPADGHRVSVSLSLAEPADEALETGVYRIMRDGEGGVTAVAQPVNGNGGSTAVVETDGRLCYVLELARTPEDSPELSYHDVVDGMVVDIAAPAGAFPRGTVVAVTGVQEAEVLSAVEAALDVSAENSSAVLEKKVVNVRALDITFTNEEGEELQPLLPISVSLRPAEEVNDALDVAVVHIDAEGVGSEVEDAVNSNGEVTFSAESFSTYVYASVLVTHVLDSRGDTWEISVEYDSRANIPENASLSVTEILQNEEAVDGATQYETYLAKTKKALGLETGVFDYVHFFDIKIVDGDGEKAEIAAPVEVRMKLADCEHFEEPQIVHFADGAENGDLINAVTLEEEAICFETESFSAYAIVEGPEAIPLGWHKVASINDLISLGESGLYIGHPDGYYYGNTLVDDGSRTGITKTKPASSSPPEGAAKYYLEQDAETGQFHAYCFAADGVTKQYVFNGGNNSLSFTEEPITAFTVEMDSDGKFTLHNGAWYWNMQGGANGSRFCAYNNANDINNKVYFWYYSAVTEDPYELDGKSYGLMNWNGGVAGKAMMASSTALAGSLDAKPLTVMSKAEDNTDKLFVPSDSDISMWSFEWVENDIYYLTAGGQYLKINSDGLSLEDSPEAASLIQVVPGTGIHAGEICLKSGDSTLTYRPAGDNIPSGFTVGGSSGSEWLHLVDYSELTSDYFMTYSAAKVSVSDPSIKDGSRVIVYTRSWNEEKLRYDFYAISSDGTLVPVYESGDSIEWVGGQFNEMLWNFVEYYWEGTTDPNYYYELYNQYSEKYIAPQLTPQETGVQILSDNTIGINMNGRRDGQYYSTILAWDDPSYAFAGLKVENGQIVPCPKDEAMDFYFAVMQDLNVDDVTHTVPTVDHTQYGITMKIVDFKTRAEMSTFLGNDEGGIGPALHQGLLSTDLGADGYPTAKMGSLGALYNNGTQMSLREVNHLFIASTYYSSGYFMYDSTETFASLKGNDFKVYRELGSYDSPGERPTLKHGQFFPFNDLSPGVFTSVNRENLYDLSVELPDDHPRKHERLYSIRNADCYFAVELEACFWQTPNGLDAWGHDIIFEFTGDDDFWLYVDGELVIDLGGIHSAVPGSVNFRTGDVNVNGTETTLRELFESNYLKRNPGASTEEVDNFLNKYFEEGCTVFKDNTEHTMRIFYMERGAGASNLQMRFNLSSLKKGTVELTKELSGVDPSEEVLAEFPYQIWYETEDGNDHLLTNKKGKDEYYVYYKDSSKPVEYKDCITIGGIEYKNVFFLKPGETADISFPEGMTSYRIVECGINTNVYSKVGVNGEEVTGTPVAENREDFGIGFATTSERPKVKYGNEVNPIALRSLTIQKNLFAEDGTTEIHYKDDKTTFTFRLYLATEFDNLDLVNMQTYHVKDPQGNYCRWNEGGQQFEKIGDGIKEYSDLTEEQKKEASFSTSVYGTISKIPIDHTVEIRNVLAGTQFRVQERPWEIPDGYSFQKYIYKGESYTSATEGVVDTVVAGQDPSVVVCNLKGWGLCMNKVWLDADYMDARDAAWFAVFIKEGNNLCLVEDSTRQLSYSTNPETQTLYWYFPHLEKNITFDQYEIREVSITESGSVTPIEEGGKITINGWQKGDSGESPFEYSVSYSKGGTTADSNVRVDTVTNSRPGIRIQKQDWSGNALAGAKFTLSHGETQIGEFTSDSDGLITVAFLGEGTDYTLTETNAPEAYQGLLSPVTLNLSNGTLSVNGIGREYYTLTKRGDDLVLTLKNRPYTFQAVKVDASTGSPLKGAVFSLHKQKTVDGVTSIDLNPMPGYEGLETSDDGVIIPKSGEYLPAGTYELREKEEGAPEGYKKLASYIQFTISDTAVITLHEKDSAGRGLPDGVALSEKELEDGTISYVLSVPNKSQASFIDIKVSKIWDDENDKDGIRPLGIQVQLKANRVPVDDPITLPVDNKWEYTWTELPVEDGDGSVIEYTVEEIRIPDEYKAEIRSESTGFIITNTHVPERVNISGVKVWDDSNNKDKLRPETVTVILLADGTQKDTAETSAADNWSWSFENLPKYIYTVHDDGSVTKTEIVYTVDESAVPHYKKTITKNSDGSFTITNKHRHSISPKTGDDTNLWLWMTTMILSGFTLLADVLLLRRKKPASGKHRKC